MTIRRVLCGFFFLLILCLSRDVASSGAAGRELPEIPRRVVSLYPTASEILSGLGAGGGVVGVTWHDSALPGLEGAALVGGFAEPDLERVLALEPDLVIYTDFQEPLAAELRGRGVAVLRLDTLRLEDGPAAIRSLGQVMGREAEAEALVAREQAQLDLAAAKTARLDPAARPRVLRFMGFAPAAGGADGMRVPGDDSFQNEYIRLAGGAAPVFGQNGASIVIGPEQWHEFAPDYIYWCGAESDDLAARLAEPPWAGVPVATLAFPCDLICRVADDYGFFTAWLASELHAPAFSRPEFQIEPDQVTQSRALDLDFSYVRDAGLYEGRFLDATAKTLLLRFNEPLAVLSSLSGPHPAALAVGNHYSAPPAWPLTHWLGYEATNARLLAMLGLEAQSGVLLHTGADMGHFALARAGADGLAVAVLATAGVSSNAMRASLDSGDYVEPGTINLIVLTNRRLTGAAMSRALITATEAKTAALEDLDIRSSYSGAPATGTGTDNIVVVAGTGAPADMTGGHTRLGELIARAAHQAVTEAVLRQNALRPDRDIFRRLAERRISLDAFLPWREARDLERLLLAPRYADFLKAALALDDAQARGLTAGQSFPLWCQAVADEVAGRPVEPVPALSHPQLPPALGQALGALIAGLRGR